MGRPQNDLGGHSAFVGLAFQVFYKMFLRPVGKGPLSTAVGPAL